MEQTGEQAKRFLYHDANAPSVSLAFPPVGWQRTLPHAAQRTTVCACEKTVVIAKQPSVEGYCMRKCDLPSITRATYQGT